VAQGGVGDFAADGAVSVGKLLAQQLEHFVSQRARSAEYENHHFEVTLADQLSAPTSSVKHRFGSGAFCGEGSVPATNPDLVSVSDHCQSGIEQAPGSLLEGC
jgi:hypothetical protein